MATGVCGYTKLMEDTDKNVIQIYEREKKGQPITFVALLYFAWLQLILLLLSQLSFNITVKITIPKCLDM